MRAVSLLVALLLVSLAACAPPVTVHRVHPQDIYASDSASILDSGQPSRFTRIVLQKAALEEQWEDNPERALISLYHRALKQGADGDESRLLALAELSFLRGRATRARSDYLGAAVFAYLHLFSDAAPPLTAWDPRTRIAADVYNRALARAFEDDDSFVLAAGRRTLPGGSLVVSVPHKEIRWRDGVSFGRFLPADAFEVDGLESRYRNAGIGAPLIAKRTDAADRPRGERAAGMAGLLPRQLAIPATAFLRVHGSLRDLARGNATAELELHDPLRQKTLKVRGQQVPLEAQTTTAFAYLLGGSPVWQFEIAGFMGRETEVRTGLAMVEPWTPGKIPLVFVHGTASSPARWAGLFNELRNDPRIGDKYQFWFFAYESGNPIAFSAERLRRTLAEVREVLDPEGKDPALRNMVLAGHSQGGLLVRLAISDSTEVELEEFRIRLPPAGGHSSEDLDFMQSVIRFEPDPGVTRVIFLATPHGGSFMAAGLPGRIGSALVTISSGILSVPWNLVVVPAGKAARGEVPLPDDVFRPKTAVQNMAPNSRFVKVLHRVPMAPEVPKHSIVGVRGDGPVETGDDGVVEYESAHLEAAVSEVVVRSSHSLQSNPVTVAEVRRILLEHLREDTPLPQ